MSLLLVLAATVAIFVYIGRSSTPAKDRRPMARSPREAARNFWRGLGVVSAPNPVNQALDAFDKEWPFQAGSSDSAEDTSTPSNRSSQSRLVNF